MFACNPGRHRTLLTLHLSLLWFSQCHHLVFFLPLQFFFVLILIYLFMGFPSGSAGKNLPADAGDEGWEDLLQEGNHPSILGWRLPGTEEPGGLQSTGSQRQTGLIERAGHWSDWRGLRAECEPSGAAAAQMELHLLTPAHPPCQSVPTRPGTSAHLGPGVWGPLFSNQLKEKKKEEKFYLLITWKIPTTSNSEE